VKKAQAMMPTAFWRRDAIIRRIGVTMDQSNLVYVIDDDDFVRESIDLLLTVEGFDVDSYASAADFLKAGPPCREGCVLTDFQMPGGLTGIDLLSEIVKRGFGWPVIIMTAQGTAALREMAENLGACDFLAKPFPPEVLIGAVQKALMSRYAG